MASMAELPSLKLIRELSNHKCLILWACNGEQARAFEEAGSVDKFHSRLQSASELSGWHSEHPAVKEQIEKWLLLHVQVRSCLTHASRARASKEWLEEEWASLAAAGWSDQSNARDLLKTKGDVFACAVCVKLRGLTLLDLIDCLDVLRSSVSPSPVKTSEDPCDGS